MAAEETYVGNDELRREEQLGMFFQHHTRRFVGVMRTSEITISIISPIELYCGIT